MFELMEKHATKVVQPNKGKPDLKNLMPREWAAVLDRINPQLDTGFLESVHSTGGKIIECRKQVGYTAPTMWRDGKCFYEYSNRKLPLPRYAVWEITETHCNVDYRGYQYWDLAQCSRVVKVINMASDDVASDDRNMHCQIATVIPAELKKQVRDMTKAITNTEVEDEINFFIIAETKPEDWRAWKPIEADPMLVVTAFGKCWVMGIWDATTGEEEVYLTYTKQLFCQMYLKTYQKADKMSNDEKIKAITAWQENGEFHPLTCGTDSKHSLLVPEEDEDGNVVLKCKDCDYTQKHVPPVVLEE